MLILKNNFLNCYLYHKLPINVTKIHQNLLKNDLITLSDILSFWEGLNYLLKENEFNCKKVGELNIGKTPFSILRKNNDRL